MPFITDKFSVESSTPYDFLLLKEVRYRGKHETFTIPIGTRTDFVTNPSIFNWLVPKLGVYTRAAILHDYLCEVAYGNIPGPNITRRDADGLFRRVLRELGVSLPRRWFMWAGVRTVSFMSDATFKEWMQYLLVSPLAIVFLTIPTVVLGLWAGMFWLMNVIGPR